MTMTNTHETEITVDPDVPLIRITREFDAPPEKVFRAHVDPELFVQWVGPRGHDVSIDRWDARTGGGYRYTVDTGDFQAGFFGSFHELRPGELIVQTFTFEGVPDGVALERMVLVDLGDGRTRIESTSLCDSFEGRDAMVASGMDTGVNEGYEKLDELLAGLR
jgi:uncharacterized protein YndB with AHSA1/START domain